MGKKKKQEFQNIYPEARIPKYLSRSKNLSTGLDESVKPKFTRSVKDNSF